MVTGEKEEKGRDSQFGFRFIFVGIGDDCGNYDYEFDDGCTGCRESSNFLTQNGKREITDMTIGSREHSIMSQRSWQCHNQQGHGDHDDGHACCHVRCRRGLVMLVGRCHAHCRFCRSRRVWTFSASSQASLDNPALFQVSLDFCVSLDLSASSRARLDTSQE
jgi:hypothetical protein